MTISRSLSVLGATITVNGTFNATFANSVVITGNTSVGNVLSVTGNTSIGGNTTVTGSLVANTLTANSITLGSSSLANNLVVAANGTIGGNLAVTGASTFANNVTIGGVLTANTLVITTGGNLSLSNLVSTANVTSNGLYTANLQYLYANGATLVANNATISSGLTANNLTVTGNASLTSYTFTNLQEQLTYDTTTTVNGTINVDCANGSVFYYFTQASGSFTYNLRGNSTVSFDTFLANSRSYSLTFVNRTGGTGYVPSFSIDGVVVTTIKPYGSAFQTDINTTHVYAVTIFKTAAATYTAFASQARYQ
jgi:cytoskeletal protein CcmA (bactofilin family)